ncbi:uncharacterized protein [Ptychodera flava]|uniref:uncharacterized protein n=1 Tax=Ptychodera flava TaxID=63121 RepID=UPI003969CE1C
MIVEMRDHPGKVKYSQRTRDVYPVVVTLTDEDCTLKGVEKKIAQEIGYPMKILDVNNYPIHDGPTTSDPVFWKSPRKVKAIPVDQFQKLRGRRYRADEEGGAPQEEDRYAEGRSTLTCIICMDIVTFPAYICHGCNLLVGCYACIVRCRACPNCRHDINIEAGPVRGLDDLAKKMGFNFSSNKEIAAAAAKRVERSETSSDVLEVPHPPSSPFVISDDEDLPPALNAD